MVSEKEQSLAFTQAVSSYIIRYAPVISYTNEEMKNAESGFSQQEKEILREAGWLKEDFENFYVISRFVNGIGLQDRASDRFLQLLYQNARKLDAFAFRRDPYLAHIRVPEIKLGRFQLKNMCYQRGEILQYAMPDLSVPVTVPRLGFFTEEVTFPAVYEGEMPWVSVCPSEISSMAPDVARAHGRVLVLGLGLGWYPYCISLLPCVESITVVELSGEVIRLFRDHLLPQFEQKKKIRLVQADAFDYLKQVKPGQFDFCYADIWESQLDGAEAYQKIQPFEGRLPGMEFAYWIREQILWQLDHDGAEGEKT